MPFPPMETAFFVCFRPARHLYCLQVGFSCASINGVKLWLKRPFILKEAQSH